MTISVCAPDLSLAARLWGLPAADLPEDAAFALSSALRTRLGASHQGGVPAPFAIDAAGMPVLAPIDPAAMTAARRREIARLRLVTGDAEVFDDAVLPAVLGWAAYAQGLPAAPPITNGAELFGLFDCGLLTAAAAAERLDQKLLAGTKSVRERRALTDAMRLAAILSGLLHAARVLGRLQIAAGRASGGTFVRESVWRPETGPLRQFALEAALLARRRTLFSATWLPAESGFSGLSSLSILHALLTPAAKSLLTSVPAVWAALEAAAAGDPGDPGAPEGTPQMLAALLSESVMRAASRVAFERARAAALREGGSGPGLSAWGEALEYAFKALIGRRVWTINEPPFFPDAGEAGGLTADAAISLAWGLDGMYLPWPAGVLAASAFLREAFAMTGCPSDPHETAMILTAAGVVLPSPDGTPFWTVRLPPKRAMKAANGCADDERLSAEALRLADPMRWASLHAAARRRAGESLVQVGADSAVRPMNLRLSAWSMGDDLSASAVSDHASLGTAATAGGTLLQKDLLSAKPAVEDQGDFPTAVAQLQDRLLSLSQAAENEAPTVSNAPSDAPPRPKARKRPGNLRGRSFFAFRLRPRSVDGYGDSARLAHQRLSRAISALSMRRDAGDFVLPEGLVVPIELLGGCDLRLEAEHWRSAGLLAVPKVIEKKFWAIAARHCAQAKRLREITKKSGKKRKGGKADQRPSARERVEAFVLARRPTIDLVPADALAAGFQKLVERTDRAAAPINESLRMADQAMADALESDLRPMMREGVLVAKAALGVEKRWENGDASPCGWPAPGRYAAFAEGILAERIAALSRRIRAEAQKKAAGETLETAVSDRESAKNTPEAVNAGQTPTESMDDPDTLEDFDEAAAIGLGGEGEDDDEDLGEDEEHDA